ncbi:hypothetical protein AS594_35225 [Streptomyces agglomeratus]|uniref:Uncharacterized protein n=1 Tax=Streptomyces agglomeratus TaxID=285458 RepID=A0A1E5PH97_9ACTN|nr:hypothetical protein [Streptomyces agglomeratus]OEJ28897.1 hypothetical protein AS594_35225 [Streptomyces agglomeratus]
MADIARSFISELSGLWGEGYWVTWHPSTRHSLGDIGTVSAGSLVPISTLEENGITSLALTPETRDELSWRTKGQVDVTFKAVGNTAGGVFSALADAQAGALVEFKGDNSVLVSYRGLTESRLASQPVLAAEMVSRYWAGTWPKEWCVVSHLVTAEHGTVLAGGEKGSTVELAAQATVGPAPAAIADLAVRMKVARSKGLTLELLGEAMTPFFRILRLRRKFLNGIEAVYGASPLRIGSGRPSEIPQDILEEARSDPDTVLEFASQADPIGEQSA